jgi:hypothetical protein
MPSLQITITPNRRAAARFVGNVRRALQKAFVEEQKKHGLTQSIIARLLNVHRSVINRELKGLKDMTLGRVAELAWAMGRRPVFLLEGIETNVSANFPVTTAIQRVPPPVTLVNTTATTRSMSSIAQIIPLASAA